PSENLYCGAYLLVRRSRETVGLELRLCERCTPWASLPCLAPPVAFESGSRRGLVIPREEPRSQRVRPHGRPVALLQTVQDRSVKFRSARGSAELTTAPPTPLPPSPRRALLIGSCSIFPPRIRSARPGVASRSRSAPRPA